MPIVGDRLMSTAQDGGTSRGARAVEPQTVARLRVINEVSAAALARPKAIEIYRVVAAAIDRFFPYLEASVFAVDAEAGEAVLAAQSPMRDALGYRQPTSVGLVGVVAREGHSVVANDVAADPRYVAPPSGRAPCASEVCVPVFHGGEVAAVIAVEGLERDAFGEGDRLALASIANVVGLALHAADTHAQLEQKVEHLREAQCQLLHSERLADVGRLTARVAHEIRNPLTTIGGFARRMIDHAACDDRGRRYARVILDEVERLERMLSGIMDFVHPGEPEKERTDLVAVLERAVTLTKGSRAGKHIAIERDLEADLPHILADPDQLEQVFLNLVQNACEAIADHGTLTLSARRQGDDAVVRIADTGCGMTPDQLEHVFDPFFTTKAGGNGLGLVVASKIVEDHGGHILIGSEPGQGTHVHIRLPIDEAGG